FECGALLIQGAPPACSSVAALQDTGLIVVVVAVATAGALDVLDAGVRGLGAGVGHAGCDERFDLVPPRVDGVPQCPGFGHIRGEHGDPQLPACGGGRLDVVAGQQHPGVFFDGPGSTDLIGGVITIKDVLEPSQG